MTNKLSVESRIEVCLPNWIVVPDPKSVTTKWRDNILDIFDTLNEVERAIDENTTRGPSERQRPNPNAALESLLSFRESLRAGQRLVAHLGIPNHWPLPMVISVSATDPNGPTLMQLAGAEGGLPIEAPIVEELPEHVGGEGPIVTRFDVDNTSAIWASICAVRRENDIDTQILWRSRDISLVPLVLNEVIALMGAVRNGLSK